MTDEELDVYKKEIEALELKAKENIAYTQSKIVKKYIEDIKGIELGDDIPDAKDVENIYTQVHNCELYVEDLLETLKEIRVLKHKLDDSEDEFI